MEITTSLPCIQYLKLGIFALPDPQQEAFLFSIFPFNSYYCIYDNVYCNTIRTCL